MIFMKINIIFLLLAFLLPLQVNAQTEVSYTYDNLNRLTKVVYSNGTTITYTYDALGNRLTKTVTGATAQTYTITTAVTPSGSGTVTGGGTYSSGMALELNAIAYAGYKFLKWNDGVTVNPRSVTVTNDLSFIAQFEVIQNSVWGDITGEGVVNKQDLHALVDAYLFGTQVTTTTDLNKDGRLSIADITKLIELLLQLGVNPNVHHGHEYVDLGLPSGTLWATCNVGASEPEAPGDLYAWGEIETKDVYTWESYKWCDGTECNLNNKTITKYCDRGGYGILDGKISLEPEDDVAHVKWGGNWHIPTSAELQELVDNCTKKWIKLTDKLHAYEFTGPNGNSIIMPAAGEFSKQGRTTDEFYYWSSELGMSDIPANNHATHARVMEYGIDFGNYYRYRGYAVRPVISDYTPIVHQIEAPTSYNGHELVDLGLPSGTLWAKCNLGASSPEEYGCYYAWGETEGSCEGKTSFSDNTYKYYNGSEMTKYNFTDNLTDLEKSDDAAAQKWGGEWRMPTWSEMSELKNSKYTTWEWTTNNGINGLRVTSIVKGFEGNSIFLPAGGEHDARKINRLGEYGYYWSSHLDTSYDLPNNSFYLFFKSTGWGNGSTSRSTGRSIRPVVSLDAITK